MSDNRDRMLFRGVRSLLSCLLLLAPMTAAAADDPPLPSGANAILHFDLERLRGSDLYQAAEEQIGVFTRSNDKLQMFLKAAGLMDAADSLKGFTIYSFADESAPQEFAGIIAGDFPQDAMDRLERAYSPVAREVGGHVVMPVIQTPDMELVMSFLESGRLSFGTATAVEKVIGAKGQSAELRTAYGRTETRRPIWGLIDARAMLDAAFSATGPEAGAPELLGALQENPALQSLTAVGFSVDLGRDIFFELRAFTSNAETARQLGDAVKGMVALGQMGVSQARDPDLQEFFRQVIAESERDGVYISFSLTQAQMERLKTGGDLFEGVIPGTP